jgi:hypothetical protein
MWREKFVYERGCLSFDKLGATQMCLAQGQPHTEFW